ncbi:MAG: response regulator, partial [Ruminiclostridium sp.]|nr:response regulator [Ruminiclostridium sp.]
HMSHEIRTPINAILGMDEMILRESTDESTLGYAEDIRKAGNTLLGLINDILDFSKIEAGKTEIIPVDYQLSSVLNDLSNMIQPRAEEKGLKFVIRVDPSIPDFLHGDEIRLKQIIMNLLTNAVKYTKEGTVTLSAEQTREGADVYLHITVKDTGAGIKKEDIDKLFIAFERIEEERNRSVEGTGLGITITQKLLRLMDSRLEVESVYGVGSIFGFTLKQTAVKDSPIGDYTGSLARSEESRRQYHESFTAPDAWILAVDDTEMNLVVFTNLLKKTKMHIDTASSGDEAIQLARQYKYDLIFLDHRMPNKDGIETLAEMRSDEQSLNRETPAVSLTANAISGMREKYIAAGFCEYLTKPIDPVRLETMILELLPDGLAQPAIVNDTETSDETGELLEIYIGDVERMAGEIERLYTAQNWTNYTIKVHALKSTSRLVGEQEIGALAEKLEKAGDAGDIDFIHEHTDELLAMYRAVPAKYGRETAPAEEEPAYKPEATEQMMHDAYADMHAAAVNFDYDALCDVLDELNDYAVPEPHIEKMKAINAAADSVDWGTLKQLLS